MAAAIPMEIRDNDEFIGETGPNSYLSWERDPGEARITGKAENKAWIDIDVAAGKVYYIWQKIKMGIIFARNKLEVVEKETVKKYLDKMKPPKVTGMSNK